MDDLFGNLPAAKHSAPNDTPLATPAAPTIASISIPAPATESVPTETEPKKSSLVTALGTAGTSMAFVPQALRKKKKAVLAKEQKRDGRLEKKPRMDGTQQIDMVEEKMKAEHITFPTDNVAIPKAERNVSSNPDENVPDTIHTNQQEGHDDNSEPYLENEPLALTQLHEQAKLNPYNPHTPNDYLAYRERKKTEAVRQDMQAAALAKIEAHERLRKQVEEERRRIEAEGDVDKIVESRLSVGEGMGRGRGRGRGLNNLPAWLVKKQMEKSQVDGQFDDADNGGYTISLLNMVAPGQIDNELADEVREECERCGRVTNVTIKDANSNNEYVKVDVVFEKKENAIDALKMFDGRMFGERKIIAKMCNGR